jgi:hypothetical protein
MVASPEADKGGNFMKKFFAMTVLVLIAALTLSADVYVKQKTHTDAIMGQPARDDVMEQWIGDSAFATVSPDQSFVVDLKKNMVYMINHKSKTYVESALPLDFSKLLPPEYAAMASMMKMTATVSPTTETKKVGQWNCTGYDVTMTTMGMPMKMRIWASTDVPFDVNQFNAKIWGNVLKGQMMLDDASVKEMMKIKGFQIASALSGEMMGMKINTSTEVLEITKKTAPASVYAPPAGYAKKDKLSMEDLQKR